jgi:hypothetical protein
LRAEQAVAVDHAWIDDRRKRAGSPNPREDVPVEVDWRHRIVALAFHKYSDGRYEPSIHFDGSGRSSPEACLDCAAQVYLR